MRHVRRIKFGTGVQLINIYRIQDGRVSHVDSEYTDGNGIMRWMPPTVGEYNLICEAYPEYSVTGYKVEGEGGFADNFQFTAT